MGLFTNKVLFLFLEDFSLIECVYSRDESERVLSAIEYRST